MILIVPFVAILVGVILGLFVNHPFTGELGQYIAVACLAAMDTIFGGIRSGIEGKFRTDIFLTGFISNVLIATWLAWIGDKIFIDLFLAVSLVLGGRIFLNLSQIRRGLINEWTDRRERKRLEQQAKLHANQQTTSTNPIAATGNAASAENR